MKFTQFLFPNGRRTEVETTVPPDIEDKARQLEEAGWSFEIECDPATQLVHMDCCTEEEQLTNRVCPNGPEVPVKVRELVTEAHERWMARKEATR